MPEPLVCEDSDLARLMETVHSQPGARILYQDTIRRGGVLGFFAREVHRVAYDVQPELAGIDAIQPLPGAPVDLAMADLLASADAIESAANTGPDGEAPEFAELLHRLTRMPELPLEASSAGVVEEAAAEPATEPAAEPAAEPARPAREPLASVAFEEPQPELASVTPFGRTDARNRLDLLMQLRQVGVPVSVNPRGEAHSLYQALEEILEELPAPVSPPRRAGEVLAIVGDSAHAIQAARHCAGMLRIPETGIGVAGLAAESAAALDLCHISGIAEAQRLRADLRLADTPSVVVIATDSATAEPEDPWAAELLAALCPTAAWAVVDARWKTEDSVAFLAGLPGIDALVVQGAQLSTSPASVWDLDLPLALLDGRTPTTFAWTGLLLRLLGTDARHRASA